MIKRVKEYLNSKITKPKISEKYLTFSVFVILSTVLWFLNALDNEYVTEIKYKIEFFNFPEDKILISDSNINITAKVSASGYDIIGNLEKNRNIKLNLKKYAIKYYPNKDSNKYYILTDIINQQIYSSTNSKVKILNIDPDSIILKLSKTISKKVAVFVDTDIKFAPLFMKAGEIKTIPDSVIISGLEDDINKINYISTQHIKIVDIKDAINKEIQLVSTKNIITKTEKVKLIIPVEKYTENKNTIPINVINLPDTLSMITFPENIRITYKVGMSRYMLIENSDFKAIIDFKTTDNILPNKFKVELVKYPYFIESIKIEPEYVDYIVKMK